METIKPRLIICSGYYNPVTIGHIEYLKLSFNYMDSNDIKRGYTINRLCVIINNDEQVKLKGSVPFMRLQDRCTIMENLNFIHRVVPSIDMDLSVCSTIRSLSHIFKNYREVIICNSGDVNFCREEQICGELGIKLVYLEGKKIESSSNLIKKAIDYYNANLRVQGST